MARFLHYANFDDGLRDHRKFIRLLGHDDGEMAFNAWIRLVLWAHSHADPHKPAEAGLIEPAVAKHILGADWERYIDLLSDAVLLDPLLDGTWQLHDFAEHQDLAGWARRQDNASKGGQARAAQRSAQSTAGGSTLGSALGSAHIPNPTQPNQSKDQNTSSPAAAFDAFWRAYPRKVGKDSAQRSFDRAITKATVQQIMTGLQRYATKCVSDKTETKFIVHPTTWLNQGRWDDDEESGAAEQEQRITSWGKRL